jgi:hypothetical protein
VTFDKMGSQLLMYVGMDAMLTLAAVLVWLVWRWYVLPKLGAAVPAGLRLPAFHKFSEGVLLALAALALALVPGYIAGGFTLGPGYLPFQYGEGSAFGEAGLIWGFFAVQSLFEELAFRGVGLGLLGLLFFWIACLLGPGGEETHTASVARLAYQRQAWFICGLAANCAVSLAFGYIHRNNPHVGAFALANIVLAGLVLGQLYWQQGQPLGAWAWHWCWNAGQASLGLPVSGIAIAPPLLTGLGFTGARAGVLTGGVFGLEGSWPCGLALALLLVYMLSLQWQELKRLAKQG